MPRDNTCMANTIDSASQSKQNLTKKRNVIKTLGFRRTPGPSPVIWNMLQVRTLRHDTDDSDSTCIEPNIRLGAPSRVRSYFGAYADWFEGAWRQAGEGPHSVGSASRLLRGDVEGGGQRESAEDVMMWMRQWSNPELEIGSSAQTFSQNNSVNVTGMTPPRTAMICFFSPPQIQRWSPSLNMRGRWEWGDGSKGSAGSRNNPLNLVC